MLDLPQMIKRQKVLADFGEFALHSESLDAVLTEACRLVSMALGTSRAKILEIQDDGRWLLVRAGVGWDPGIVGHLRLSMSQHSSETFAIAESRPVVTQDIRKEERFDIPEFLRNAGVIALVNVPIRIAGGKPYGLLQVDATEPRDFGPEDTEFLRTYATILGPVIDRLQKVSSLRSTEERFRLVIESAYDYAIFTTDPQDRITDWYAGAAAVFGWTAEEAIGHPAAIMFTPEDREAGQDVREIETARRVGSAPNVRWHVRKDGSRVFIHGTTTTLRADDGSLRGFLKIGQDVTERHRAEQALRESEERFRTLASLVPVLLWRSDASGQQNSSNQPWLDYTGQTLEQSQGSGWLDPVHVEDQAAAREAFRAGHETGQTVEVHLRVRGRDDRYRWFLVRQAPIIKEGGGVTQWFGAAMDIDDLRRSQEQQKVMVAELQHRTRNLLGVVRSIARETMARAGPGEEFQEQLHDRLSALSRVQGLLSHSDHEPITIGMLIQVELDALGIAAVQDRIRIDGPPVRLRKATVQTFALALHELATNARKYGAFTTEHGRLSVTWRSYEVEPNGRRLLVEWVEEGLRGPREEQGRVSRGGYGRELIERALPYVLQAETSYELSDTMLRCSIDLPLTDGSDENGRS